MKKILIGLGVLVVIAAVGVYIFLGSLNDIVRAAVEKVGSEMTQTNVSLNEVDIELTSGKGALRGFSVTNPDGFSDDDAFKFDEVSVVLDIATIRSDPIVIKEVIIQGPAVVYEFGDNGGSNLDQLNKNVQSKAGADKKSSDGDKKGPNIVIENLYLRDGTVSVLAPLLNEKMSIPLPAIHLKDIGKDGGKGATPEEIADKVMAAVLKGAKGAVSAANIDVSKLTGAVMDQIKNVTGGTGDLQKKIEDATGGTGDLQKKIEDATGGSGTGDIGKDAGSAIKGLLGK